MRRHSPSRAGFTLVEAVIAVALLVLLFSSAILAAKGGMGAFRVTQGTTDAETRVRRALDRVAFELLSAGGTTLLPDPSGAYGTASLQYQRAVGLNGTTIQWGELQRVAFEYEPGELDDGIDNDGNGLVDDGALVITHDAGGAERRQVLCHGVREMLEGEEANGDDDNANGVVDEAGFNAHRLGNVLVLRLSVEEPAENGPIVRTLETTVRLRN